MKKYTQQEVNNIPMIFKCHWYPEWIKEQNKSDEYLGKLAILTQETKRTKANKKIIEGYWITEGIDFVIVD